MRGTTRKLVGSLCLLFGFVILSTVSGLADQVVLEAAKDNTIWEDSSGSLSNGAGVALFAGVNGPNGGTRITRALVAFDLSAIPAGSTISSVTLELNQSNTSNNNSSTQTLTLQSLLKDWGEGSSNATQGEGGGASATTGDATWLHTFFNTNLWGAAGGDFSSLISATTQVAGNGKYSWGSSAQLVADVQGWIDDPATNFGWILRGNESFSRTAKRFDSRNSGNASNRPHLTIVFDTAPPAFTSKLFFAQFGNGPGLISDIVLTNPSATNTISGRVDFLDDNGLPFLAGIVGTGETSSVDFSVSQLGTTTISTDGQGAIAVVGSAVISSESTLGGVIRFNIAGIGIAGVGTGVPLSGFITPVRRTAGGINTGVAIHNTEETAVTLDLTLRDPVGRPVLNGTATIADFPAGGHLAQFIGGAGEVLFPDADTDDFQGTLVVQVTGGKVATTVLELGTAAGEFTTLPVTPLE